MKQKIISIFLSAVMIIMETMPYCAFADESIDIDAYLLNHGFTNAIISTMLDEDKQFYYNEGCTIIDATQYNYDEKMNLISVKDLTNATGNIVPYGQISSTSLSLTWYISKNSSGNIVVQYTYVWNKVPINRFQDPIGISWDPNYLKMKDNGFNKADYYIFVDNGGTEHATKYSEENSYANGSESGVVWYAKLFPSKCKSLRGRGRVTLIPKKSSGSTTLYGNYVHKKMVGSLSMSIPKFGSFSVSGGSSYDERGNQKTFNI